MTDAHPPAPEPDLSLRGPLRGLFKKLDEQKSSLIQRILTQWGGLAGDMLAAHSQPARLADNVLYIYVDSSAWLNEISRFHASHVLRLLQKTFGADKIKRVNYQVNPECRRRENSD